MDIPVTKVDMLRGRPRGGRGTLLVDNTVSGGQRLEYDTLTCAHCNSVVVLNPARTRERGFCFSCNAYVCDDKRCAEGCYSMQRCLDLVLADPTIPALPRAYDGGLLFDPELLRKRQF